MNVDSTASNQLIKDVFGGFRKLMDIFPLTGSEVLLLVVLFDG